MLSSQVFIERQCSVWTFTNVIKYSMLICVKPLVTVKIPEKPYICIPFHKGSSTRLLEVFHFFFFSCESSGDYQG